MMRIRKSEERGRTALGWLDSRHGFSFGGYFDPENVDFGHLVVFNEDHVAPGMGFGMHRHSDMEIISYVIDGSLEHKDNLGTGSVIRPGDVQKMSAGTGIMHSEFNGSKEDPVHFLQIWIRPARRGLEPDYQQVHFTEDDRRDKLCLIAGGRKDAGAIHVAQDIRVYASLLAKGSRIEFDPTGRRQWFQVVSGSVNLNGEILNAGDAASVEDEGSMTILGEVDSHFLLFDMG